MPPPSAVCHDARATRCIERHGGAHIIGAAVLVPLTGQPHAVIVHLYPANLDTLQHRRPGSLRFSPQQRIERRPEDLVARGTLRYGERLDVPLPLSPPDRIACRAIETRSVDSRQDADAGE